MLGGGIRRGEGQLTDHETQAVDVLGVGALVKKQREDSPEELHARKPDASGDLGEDEVGGDLGEGGSFLGMGVSC